MTVDRKGIDGLVSVNSQVSLVEVSVPNEPGCRRDRKTRSYRSSEIMRDLLNYPTFHNRNLNTVGTTFKSKSVN